MSISWKILRANKSCFWYFQLFLLFSYLYWLLRFYLKFWRRLFPRFFSSKPWNGYLIMFSFHRRPNLINNLGLGRSLITDYLHWKIARNHHLRRVQRLFWILMLARRSHWNNSIRSGFSSLLYWDRHYNSSWTILVLILTTWWRLLWWRLLSNNLLWPHLHSWLSRRKSRSRSYTKCLLIVSKLCSESLIGISNYSFKSYKM